MAHLPSFRFWMVVSLLLPMGCTGRQGFFPAAPSTTTPLSVPQKTSAPLTEIPPLPAECPEKARVTYQKLATIFEAKSDRVSINALDRQILNTLGNPQYAKRSNNQITYEWLSPDCAGWYIQASFNDSSHFISTAEMPPPIGIVPSQEPASGLRYTLIGHRREVEALALTPDGQTIVSGSPAGEVHTWQTSDGQHLRTLDADDWIGQLRVSPDGKTILGLGRDLTTWDLATGNLKQKWQFVNGGSSHNIFGPDQRLIISEINDETVHVWNIETQKRVASFSPSNHRIGNITFHPNRRILADAKSGDWGANQNPILLWDVTSGKQIQTLTGHNYFVRSILFSPNGSVLATGEQSALLRKPPVSEIKLWNWQKGVVLRSLPANVNGILSMVFSRDGQRLVTGSINGSIDVWEVATGKRLQTLTGHTKAVIALTLDAKGQVLVSGSDDRTVKVWKLN